MTYDGDDDSPVGAGIGMVFGGLLLIAYAACTLKGVGQKGIGADDGEEQREVAAGLQMKEQTGTAIQEISVQQL